MGNRLRQSMAELATRGADSATPVDPAQSLSAMAALLQAVRGETVRKVLKDEETKSAQRHAGGEDRDRRDDRASDIQDASAGRRNAAGQSHLAEASAAAKTLAGLSRELDHIEDHLRAKGEIEADQPLKRALKELETRLQQAVLRCRQGANAGPQQAGKIAEFAACPQPASGDEPRSLAAEAEHALPAENRAGLETGLIAPTAHLTAIHDQVAQSDRETGLGSAASTSSAIGAGHGQLSSATLEAAKRGAEPRNSDVPDLEKQRQTGAGEQTAAPTMALYEVASTRATQSPCPESRQEARTFGHELGNDLEFAAPRQSFDPALYDALERQIENAQQRMSERLEASLAATAIETDDLKHPVETRAGSIDPKRSPHDDGRAIEALQREVAAIGRRLDGADQGFASMAALEQTIGRLFEQMEENRRTAADAAAQTRPAGESPSGQQSQHAEGDDGREQAATRELADLRAAREDADRRLHLALSAVQESVGQIADRLSKMEADLSEMRAPPASLLSMLAPRSAIRHKAEPGTRVFPSQAPESAAETSSLAPLKSKEKAQGHFGGDPSPAVLAFQGAADPAEVLIEPGGGFPRQREAAEPRPQAVREPERDASAARADFIAAARRAAHVDAGRVLVSGEADGPGQAGGSLNKRRPLIIVLAAALCIALCAYAVARMDALKGLDPAGFLKSFGRNAASDKTADRRPIDVDGSRQPAAPARSGQDSATDKAIRFASRAEARAPLGHRKIEATDAGSRSSSPLDPNPLDPTGLASSIRRTVMESRAIIPRIATKPAASEALEKAA